MRFTDKVTVVTAAGSGFGEAIATQFAVEGAKVVAADIDESGVVSATRRRALGAGHRSR